MQCRHSMPRFDGPPTRATWGARCGKSARRVLRGGTGTSDIVARPVPTHHRVNHDRLLAKTAETVSEKSAVARPWERKFLGLSFTNQKPPKRRLAPKAMARFISLVRMVHDLAEYLRGWIGYFGRCETLEVLDKLEKWLRRRLRSMVWKQWKRGTTRYRELRKRGIAAQDAAKTAGSSDGPWHLANTPALKIALSNAYFASLGLPELTARG